MRVIIVGAGLVGVQLARRLIEEKHDVSIIEASEERARYVSNRLDCMVLHDEGNSVSALEAAGIAKADALVCVTDSDEVNMIICGLGARYPRLQKIARVRNDEYVRGNFQHQLGKEGAALGIDFFIHPDVEAARSTLDAIGHGAIGDILSFAGTSYELGSIDISGESPFNGLPLTEFRRVLPGESLVTLVERRGACILPKGSTTLTAGDRLYLLAKEAVLDEGFRLAGRGEKTLKKIGILGGGRLGSLIAAGIFHEGEEGRRLFRGRKGRNFFSFINPLIPKIFKNVVIFERDYEICKELAGRFPEALVLNEDISDESFISEEQIEGLDLIVTATEQQELNIITAVYLKTRGVKRAIAMVSGSGYATVARQLGVDVVIPLKSVVVDSILARLMGGGVKGLHRLGDGSVGILDIEIAAGSPAQGKALKDFRLPGDALVMLVTPPPKGVSLGAAPHEDGTSSKGESVPRERAAPKGAAPHEDGTSSKGDAVPRERAAPKEAAPGGFIPRGDYVYAAGARLLIIARNGTEQEIQLIFGEKR